MMGVVSAIPDFPNRSPMGPSDEDLAIFKAALVGGKSPFGGDL